MINQKWQNKTSNTKNKNKKKHYFSDQTRTYGKTDLASADTTKLKQKQNEL